MKKIYQQTVKEVLDRVKSRESGLTDEEVKRSREACGWNELTEGKKKSFLVPRQRYCAMMQLSCFLQENWLLVM